jgi:hypothetical protein
MLRKVARSLGSSKAPGRQWSWQHWSECKCCSHGEIKCVRTPPDRTTKAPSAAACTVPLCPTTAAYRWTWGAWWCFRAFARYASNQHSPVSPCGITGHFPCWLSHQTPTYTSGIKNTRGFLKWMQCNHVFTVRFVTQICGMRIWLHRTDGSSSLQALQTHPWAGIAQSVERLATAGRPAHNMRRDVNQGQYVHIDIDFLSVICLLLFQV